MGYVNLMWVVSVALPTHPMTVFTMLTCIQRKWYSLLHTHLCHFVLQSISKVVYNILSHCVGVSKETVGLYGSYHRVITTRLSPGCEFQHLV